MRLPGCWGHGDGHCGDPSSLTHLSILGVTANELPGIIFGLLGLVEWLELGE